MVERFDDSDMKIVGSAPSKAEEPRDNETVNLYEEQKQNGNIAKAQRVGATLAGDIDALSVECEAALPSDDMLAVQKKLLMIFSFVAGIEEFSPNKLIVRTTLNVFYDTLKKEDPALYESMGLTGAFSFYYLEYRRSGDATANIANAFAMLCGAESDSAYVETGSAVFEKYYSFVKELIAQVEYAN
ncbi:MAG: hypothetical protein E7546_03505 [Ruminococcaceae bacterium]|nr:hypothetical protein [Oscillospiraceae bacterium]